MRLRFNKQEDGYALPLFHLSEKFHDVSDIYLHFINTEIEALKSYMVYPNSWRDRAQWWKGLRL